MAPDGVPGVVKLNYVVHANDPIVRFTIFV